MKASVEYLCDVLIIGSGAAGLSLALRLADQAKVLVLSKGPISEGALSMRKEASLPCSTRPTASNPM